MSFAALFSLRLREPCPRGRRERLTAGVAIRKKYRHHQRRRRDLPSFLTLARMDTDGNCSPAAPRCAWTGQYGSSEVANAGAEAWDRRYYANLRRGQRSQSVALRMQSLKSKKDVIEEAWQTKKSAITSSSSSSSSSWSSSKSSRGSAPCPAQRSFVALGLLVGALVQCLLVVACGRLG